MLLTLASVTLFVGTLWYVVEHFFRECARMDQARGE